MTILRLGDFTFVRGEVPESIGFGASQNLHVHSLVGGARVVDAMGAAPLQIEWSAWLIGPRALTRARYLKGLAEAGEALALSFGAFAYSVVIARFSAEFRAGPNLPYTIALEVVRDQSSSQTGAGLPGIVQMVAQDVATVVADAVAIGDGGLSQAANAISAQVSASGSQFNPATVRPLLPAIAAAQAKAAALDRKASGQISALGAAAVAGTGPDPLNQFGVALIGAAGAAIRSYQLNGAEQTLARLASNISIAGGVGGAGGAVIDVGSCDLYHLAAANYGDARRWTEIAEANHLTDPVISNVRQLVVPPKSAAPATGVLNA